MFKHSRTYSEEDHIRNIRTIFSEISPRYDLLNRIMSLRRDVYWRRRCVELLPADVRRVLDVATGTGDLAMDIARLRPDVRVTGLDFVVEMLMEARRKTADKSFGERIDYLSGDAMRIPFKDNSFDAATIAFGLRNIPDRLGALIEMVRVVRPGGRILVLDMTFHRNLGMWCFFNLYLNGVIPILGGLISHNFKAYRYLPASIQEFLHPEELHRIFIEAGMTSVNTYPLTFGITYLHEGMVGE